jgi:hypothetical protein
MLKAVILRAILGTAILLLASPPGVRAQESQNRIIELLADKPAPETKILEIVSIKVEAKPVRLGEPFPAGRSWFKTLVIRVRNISGQPIKRVSMSFNIPALDKGGRKMMWGVPYDIQRVGTSSSGTDVWDYVGPGDEVNLTFTDKLLKSSLHKWIDEADEEVTRVYIVPEIGVTFKDDSYKRGGILIKN